MEYVWINVPIINRSLCETIHVFTTFQSFNYNLWWFKGLIFTCWCLSAHVLYPFAWEQFRTNLYATSSTSESYATKKTGKMVRDLERIFFKFEWKPEGFYLFHTSISFILATEDKSLPTILTMFDFPRLWMRFPSSSSSLTVPAWVSKCVCRLDKVSPILIFKTLMFPSFNYCDVM